MQAFFSTALPLQAHTRVSYGSQLYARWANARSLPGYYGAGSGPMQGFCIRDFRPLWANSSSSAISAHLHCGPIRAYHSAALPLQGHTRVSCGSPLYSGWASARPLPKYYGAGCGAHASILHNPHIHTAGQCKNLSWQRSCGRPT